MKSNIQSHNTSLGSALKDFLLPSPARILLAFLLSVVLLSVLNARGLWNYVTGGSLSAQNTDVGDVINQKAQGLHKFLDSISAGRTLVIVFWLFVGCMVYLLVWFVSNFLNNIRNDIVADEYVHPTSYNRKSYWETIIARKIFFVCTLIILIGFLAAAIKVAIVLAKLCYIELEYFRLAHSVVLIGLSIVVIAFLLQIFSLLFKICLNTWQFIYRDL